MSEPGTGHLHWERMNDLVDGRLDAPARDEALRHVDTCEPCRDELASLRCLLAAASDAPEEIAAPADLWSDVCASIERRSAERRPVTAPLGTESQASGLQDAGWRVAESAERASVDARLTRASGAEDATTAPIGNRGSRSTSSRSTGSRAPGWRTAGVRVAPGWLAAAGLVLVALSSGITAVALRRGASEAPSVTTVASGDAPARSSSATSRVSGTANQAASGALLVSFQATERAYLQDAAELRALFDAQRDKLEPATVAVIERSLAAIDAAIVEARAALLADPANYELAELLGASYRQKVELLRRAAEFPNA